MDFNLREDYGDVVIEKDGVTKARCYFNTTPVEDGRHVGAIGEFNPDSKEEGIEVLRKCEEVLKGKGCELIIAPMNCTTWRKYRTLTYSNGEPPFLLENVDPIEHNEMFLDAGFEKKYNYTSTKGKISDYEESKVHNLLVEKMNKENVVIRHFNKENYIEDLKKIYEVALPSFYRNPLYTPITEEEFLEQYTPYISKFDEDLILIAEKEGKPVGFLFTIPDFDPHTLVVKTGVVLKEYQSFALGSIILSELKKIAVEKGYTDWIFAFMYEENTSQKYAKRHHTHLIREYALYGKNI